MSLLSALRWSRERRRRFYFCIFCDPASVGARWASRAPKGSTFVFVPYNYAFLVTGMHLLSYRESNYCFTGAHKKKLAFHHRADTNNLIKTCALDFQMYSQICCVCARPLSISRNQVVLFCGPLIDPVLNCAQGKNSLGMFFFLLVTCIPANCTHTQWKNSLFTTSWWSHQAGD